MERAARCDAEKTPLRVEVIEEWEQVALVGAAPVEEHEEPVRLAGRGAGQVVEDGERHRAADATRLRVRTA